ncbi:MAG: phosphotransferase [Armatimonadota bacterium]|nr:phosphotransferase [Armatimonadota bacterium]
MSQYDGLDPGVILTHLGVGSVQSIAQVEGGADTAVWRVQHGGEVSALRVFRADQAEPARREQIALAASAEAGIPGPTVRMTGVWQGRPVLLLSWCPGRPLTEIILSQPSLLEPLAFEFGRMQARIHTVSAPAALAASHGASLLHGDYHPGNVLADENGVTAVFDWVNVRTGDPCADLARTTLLLRLSDPLPGIPQPQYRAMCRSFEAAWRRGYESVAEPIGDLAPFYTQAGEERLHELDGKSGSVAQQARIRRWTAYWKHRACSKGLPFP